MKEQERYSFLPLADGNTKESTFPHERSFAAFMFGADAGKHLFTSFLLLDCRRLKKKEQL